jgi:PPOX class probable F420-dependent enzyme
MRRNLRPEDLADLLTQPRNAILATHFADGTTLLSPVWHEWSDGGFTILLGAGDVKTRHVRRDPRVSVVVADDRPPYRGLEVRGEAKIGVDASDASTLLRRIAIRYLGDTQGNAYANAGDPSSTAILRVEPGVLRAWDFADEYPITEK